MPRRDWPDPGDIPDMSIPERTDRAPEPASPLPPPENFPMQPHALTRSPTSMQRTAWRVGDKVLAPWEPQFLYAGRIAQLESGRALIEFDDGDAGWVMLAHLQPLVVTVGQSLLSRKHMGLLHFPGTVREIDDDEVLVEFTDSGDEEWVALAALRIPCLETGPGAEPTRIASQQAFQEHLRPDDLVWAPWVSNVLFAGRVDRIDRDELHIHFEDGDAGWVQRAQVFPLLLPVGLRVMARWKMRAQYFPGTVTAVEGTRVHVQFDDGDREWTRVAALALPCEPIGPNARPTRTASAGTSTWSWGWIIWIGVILISMLLRFALR